MGFAADLRVLCERAGDKADLVVRKLALDIGGTLIDMSPVDTGRFKNNWVTSVGYRSVAAVGSANGGGDGAIYMLKDVVRQWRPGQTIFITNNLPYARRLEYGHSKQAPNGMVRLTMQQFGDALKRAADQVRSGTP